MGARHYLDSQCKAKAGLFTRAPLCPFNGFLVLPCEQMRKGKSATEEIIKGIERAQLDRSL
jgi:hypothetical protein